MIDPNILSGTDISTEFCGIKLRSLSILSSGPLGYSAEGLIRAHQSGCGAVVTKTIRCKRAINHVQHITAFGSGSLVNCEKWSNLVPKQWFAREIPLAKQAGADMIELVYYTEDTLQALLKATRVSTIFTDRVAA